MRDLIIKGTGNSRYLKSSIPTTTTLSDIITMLRAGTFPIDFNGLNDSGINQQGTPLNTATLLPVATASKFGLSVAAFPKDVFDSVAMLTGAGAPTTATAGAIGQFYLDTSSNYLYKCTAINNGVYTWVTVNGEELLIDTTTTTASSLVSVDVSGIDTSVYRKLKIEAWTDGTTAIVVRANNKNTDTVYAPAYGDNGASGTVLTDRIGAFGGSSKAGGITIELDLNSLDSDATITGSFFETRDSSWTAGAYQRTRAGFCAVSLKRSELSTIDFSSSSNIPVGFKVRVWGQR